MSQGHARGKSTLLVDAAGRRPAGGWGVNGGRSCRRQVSRFQPPLLRRVVAPVRALYRIWRWWALKPWVVFTVTSPGSAVSGTRSTVKTRSGKISNLVDGFFAHFDTSCTRETGLKCASGGGSTPLSTPSLHGRAAAAWCRTAAQHKKSESQSLSANVIRLFISRTKHFPLFWSTDLTAFQPRDIGHGDAADSTASKNGQN